MRRPTLISLLGACAALTITFKSGATPTPAWQTHWSDAVFTRAAQEHRFVLLDLHTVWCHWCHVIDGPRPMPIRKCKH